MNECVLALNSGFPSQILSAKLQDKIWNGKPGFEAKRTESFWRAESFLTRTSLNMLTARAWSSTGYHGNCGFSKVVYSKKETGFYWVYLDRL